MPLIHVVLSHTIPLTYQTRHQPQINDAETALRRANIYLRIRDLGQQGDVVFREAQLTETVPMNMAPDEEEQAIVHRALQVARYPQLLRELLGEEITHGTVPARGKINWSPVTVTLDLSHPEGVTANVPVTVVITRHGQAHWTGLAAVDPALHTTTEHCEH